MNKERTCRYCKSWSPSGKNREDADMGECRKNAPVSLFEVPNRGYRPWVNTGKGDWCREFDSFRGENE